VQINLEASLNDAVAAYQQGNLALTDVAAQTLLYAGHRHPLALSLLGAVALSVKECKRAVDLLGEASTKAPADPEIKRLLNEARKGMREQALIRADGRKRFLLIKPWGYGFCSDLDHVLGSLLLAELTGRVPIVHWGKGSLFRDESDANAWPRFFEPVSPYTLEDLVGKKHSFFPPKWNDKNLDEPEVNKFDGEWSRMGPVLYLNRREDVAITDFHMAVVALLFWARPGTPFAGKTVPQAYRMLVRKYLKPSREVLERVEAFAARHFTSRPVIGVHARGGDKPVEDAELRERNKTTPEIVQGLVSQNPAARVFLLTDDAAIRAEYAARFGDRLMTTECARTTSAKGLHYTEQHSRAQLGIEVLVDMYLAARCDHFIGVGTSNVAAMIEHLRDWPAGTLDLRPHSTHSMLNSFLYRHVLPPELEEAFLRSVRAQQERERQG
jgi:protein O-GlcNAc transferase